MRREAPSHARLGGEATELNPDAGARPGSASRRAVDDAEQRPDRQLDACGEPGRQLLPAPGVHADLAPTATFAAAHEQRPAPRVKVALAEREGLLDAQPAAPEHGDQGPQAGAVAIVCRLAHHRDDLLHGRRVGGIVLPLVAGCATGVIAGHGRGRSPPTGGIERGRDSLGISSKLHSGQGPLLYRGSRLVARVRLPLRLRLAEAGNSSDRRLDIVRSGRLARTYGDVRSRQSSESLLRGEVRFGASAVSRAAAFSSVSRAVCWERPPPTSPRSLLRRA